MNPHMIDNMYAPPRAELTEPVVVAAPFYVVSRPKFIALFLATLSAYQLFWYYQNWQLQKRSTGEPLWPVPRTIFAVFFVHSLFERVRALGASSRLTADWNASLLARHRCGAADAGLGNTRPHVRKIDRLTVQ